MKTIVSHALKFFAAIGKSIEEGLGKEHASTLYIILNVIILFIAMAFTRINNDKFSSLQGQFWRGVIAVIFTEIVLKQQGTPVAIKDSKKEKLRFVRGFLGSGQVICVFISLKKLSISDVYLIQTSVTPLFTGIYDALILKNKYNKSEISLALISIIGVALIVKPDLFFETEITNQVSEFQYAEGTERLLWIIFLTVVQAIWCLGNIILKMLAGMNPLQVSFHYGVLCDLLSSLSMIGSGDYPILSFGFTLQLIVVFGIAGFFNQIIFVKAFQLGKPGKISLLMNLFVVFGFLFEIFYLNEYPPLIKSIGAIIVLVCSVWIAIKKIQ